MFELVVMPLTAMSKVVPSFGAISLTLAPRGPRAVPPKVTSVSIKVERSMASVKEAR